MQHQSKYLVLLAAVLMNLLIISACNSASPSENAEYVPLQVENAEINDSAALENNPSLPTQEPQEMTWNPIIGNETDEETFMKHLDTDMLISVSEKIQSLLTDETTTGEDWLSLFNSEQYHYVIDLGVKAVKPMYYILYKSEQAGLYEYIISSAINDIIGYDFSNIEGQRWANAYEFRERYNICVKESISQFYDIIDNASMSQTDKIDAITDLGIFVIAPLLNELDSNSSELDKDSICTIIKTIIKEADGNDVFDNINTWREENEEYYRNLIEILPIH